jgi:transposase InsO family protein
MAEDWLYVAAVIDLFSRRVVGWSMRAAMTAQLVTDALVMAIWRRGKPDALLHHSDRGSSPFPIAIIEWKDNILAGFRPPQLDHLAQSIGFMAETPSRPEARSRFRIASRE